MEFNSDNQHILASCISSCKNVEDNEQVGDNYLEKCGGGQLPHFGFISYSLYICRYR